METLGYYNGKIGEIADIMVPMDDRACNFGDGIYDATNTRNHVPFLLEDHVDRFYRSAARVGMECELKKPELMELLRDCARRVDSPDTQVYWQLSRGTAPRNHPFPKNAKSNLWITVRPKAFAPLRTRYALITQEDTRFLHCDIKTINLLPAVIYSQRAAEAGAKECVLHRNGRVTECAHSNVHILKNGALITAPLDNLILAGITRKLLLQKARELGIPVEERPYTLDELRNADEILFTAASALCCVANRLDGEPVGGGASELVDQLQNAMEAELIRQTD